MKFLSYALAGIAAVDAAKKYQLNNLVGDLHKQADQIGVASVKSAVDAVIEAIANEPLNSNNLDALIKADCEGGDCQTGTLNLEALFGYGCWCFFGRIDSALGRGPPVDSYDATCQKLALCYRCIFVDAENESEDCDPFTTEFAATISMNALLGGGASQNASTQCITENQSNCAWRTCSCAMTMITSFFNLSFDSQNAYDDNLKHSNGFDYNLECPQQGRAQDRQCCGFYPSRRTYDRHDARDCCHDITIYNPLRHVCCPDGSHIGLGHSC